MNELQKTFTSHVMLIYFIHFNYQHGLVDKPPRNMGYDRRVTREGSFLKIKIKRKSLLAKFAPSLCEEVEDACHDIK